jgi:hypothetical protein
MDPRSENIKSAPDSTVAVFTNVSSAWLQDSGWCAWLLSAVSEPRHHASLCPALVPVHLHLHQSRLQGQKETLGRVPNKGLEKRRVFLPGWI